MKFIYICICIYIISVFHVFLRIYAELLLPEYYHLPHLTANLLKAIDERVLLSAESQILIKLDRHIG
jgi:hypothetical protein